MKGLFSLILLLTLFGALAFGQGTPKGGQFGIQGSMSLPFTTGLAPNVMGSVGGKYFFTDALALRAAVGLANSSSGGASATEYVLAAGVEYHLGGRGGVSPYAGAQVSYSGSTLSSGASTDSDLGLRAVFGGEYFFSSNFSWAGELGLGFDSAYSAAGKSTTTTIGTAAFTTALSWYLN